MQIRTTALFFAETKLLRLELQGKAEKPCGAKNRGTYWNQGYGYQQGYGPGYGGSDDLPHGYYGYGPGYYYRRTLLTLPKALDNNRYYRMIRARWKIPLLENGGAQTPSLQLEGDSAVSFRPMKKG
ncbi:Mucin-21 [Manis pentadactyla]|nr:Mucin-21 [Manis pentadactyla]